MADRGRGGGWVPFSHFPGQGQATVAKERGRRRRIATPPCFFPTGFQSFQRVEKPDFPPDARDRRGHDRFSDLGLEKFSRRQH